MIFKVTKCVISPPPPPPQLLKASTVVQEQIDYLLEIEVGLLISGSDQKQRELKWGCSIYVDSFRPDLLQHLFLLLCTIGDSWGADKWCY